MRWGEGWNHGFTQILTDHFCGGEGISFPLFQAVEIQVLKTLIYTDFFWGNHGFTRIFTDLLFGGGGDISPSLQVLKNSSSTADFLRKWQSEL